MKYFGSHLSCADSYVDPIQEAIKQNMTALQIMPGSKKGEVRPATPEEEVQVKELIQQFDLKVAFHMPYVFNTCHPQRLGWAKKVFSETVEMAKRMGIYGIVWHPGSYKELTPEAGIENFQSFVHYLITKTKGEVLLLPENVAGTGTALANKLDRFMDMVSPFSLDKVKITLDYAHSYAHGYDWNDNVITTQTLALLGDRIGLVHCNNTPVKLGSGRDIHGSICDETISIKPVNLRYVIGCLRHVPHVLERDIVNPDELQVLQEV